MRLQLSQNARANITAGHFVQVCPTNLDPAYDEAPDLRYECNICFKRGVHYSSLCPLNRDPYSINQRRSAQASNGETKIKRATNSHDTADEETDSVSWFPFEVEETADQHDAGLLEMRNPDEVELLAGAYQEDMMKDIEEGTGSKYSHFIRKLAAARLEMTELVNEIRPRLTAWDMWSGTSKEVIEGWLPAIPDNPANDADIAGYDGNEEETPCAKEELSCSVSDCPG